MKKALIDGHIHLENGELSEEYITEIIETAHQKGFSEIHILDHSHRFREFEGCYEELKSLPKQSAWLKGEKKFRNSLKEYEDLMERMKKKQRPLKVLYGLEVCYTEKSEERLRDILSDTHFDFLTGAVHSIDGILYDMDFSDGYLWNKYPADEIYQRYYEILLRCVSSGLFSVLAHPDTIKMKGIYPSYDLKDTYRRLAKACKEYHVIPEDNTGVHYRYGHPDIGLSEELREIFLEYDTGLLPASDAHVLQDIGKCIPDLPEYQE